jgi:curved DNA-binding protein CbpA
MLDYEALREHYQKLELTPGADFVQVRTAYRLLVKTWHPDRYPHDPLMKERAEEKLREINGAFEALKRLLQDDALHRKGVAAEAAAVHQYPVTHEPPPIYQEPERRRPEAIPLSPRQFRNGWSFVDSEGRIIVPGPFSYAEPFSEGLAVVGTGRVASLSKFGYLNSQGDVAIPLQFDGASAFAEGRAAVRMKSAWGFIDRSGKYVVIPRFQMATAFSEGVSAIREAGLWGYVDLEGRYLATPRFQAAKPFVDGWGIVHIGTRMARINARGDIQLFAERFSR